MKKVKALIMALLLALLVAAPQTAASEADWEALLEASAWGLEWGISPYEATRVKGTADEQTINEAGECFLYYGMASDWGEEARITLRFREGLDALTFEFSAVDGVTELLAEEGIAEDYRWTKDGAEISVSLSEEGGMLTIVPASDAPLRIVGRPFTMEAGEWAVGRDFPAGEYDIKASGSTVYLAVYDEGDSENARRHTLRRGAEAERIAFEEGQLVNIQFTSVEFTLLDENALATTPEPAAEAFTMQKGDWIVGEHIPAGEYSLEVVSGYAAVSVYDSDAEYASRSHWLESGEGVGRMVLEDAQRVEVEYASVEFIPQNDSAALLSATEIVAAGLPFTAQKGDWIVGEHIPAGEYSLETASNYAAVSVYDGDAQYSAQSHWIEEDEGVGRMTLSDGQRIEVAYGSVEFTPLRGFAATETPVPVVNESDGEYMALDYEDFARNPDDYANAPISFVGTVVQVMEGDGGHTLLRVAADGNSKQIVYITYTRPSGASRILEEDAVRVYGEFTGLYTYQSIFGQSITLPSCLATEIEIES